jgi:periplasmic protein TonB
MLDQLVESKSHSIENTRRNELLMGVCVFAIVALLTAWTTSLFGKDYGMGSGDLELSTLVAPVPVEEQPPPKEEQKPQKDPNVDVRKEIIASMEEPPPKVPDKVSNEASKIPPRDPNKYTIQGDRNFSAANAPPPDYNGPVNKGGTGSDTGLTGGSGKTDTGGNDEPPPAAVKKAPPKTISGGVLNGKAISLPKPQYPAAARAMRASGAVQVQVLIDESGRVVSATAASGNPILTQAAVAAARGARFSPTLLSGQPVKVSGIITYNFVP